jgi:hypothetical protein
MGHESKLRTIKTIHTMVWAIFAGSISATPVLTFLGSLTVAWNLIGFVILEVVILVSNRMKYPLTDVAGRYAEERTDNFDIYFPLWLARHSKEVFGGLYVAGVVYTAWVSVNAAVF